MDSTKLLLLGGAGFAAWWFFFRQPTAASSATSSTAAPPSSTTVSGTLPVLTSNSLDTIHSQLVTAANAPTEGLNVDEWGWYLNNILASMGKGPAPDPMPPFSAAIPSFDRSQKFQIAEYWAVMAPALKTQLGLSGLGVYGGLAALSRRYR